MILIKKISFFVISFLFFIIPTIYIVSAVYVAGSSDYSYEAVSLIFIGWIVAYLALYFSGSVPFWVNPILYLVMFILMSLFSSIYPNVVVIGTILILGFVMFTFEKIRRMYFAIET
jgi:hypothetical protein